MRINSNQNFNNGDSSPHQSSIVHLPQSTQVHPTNQSIPSTQLNQIESSSQRKRQNVTVSVDNQIEDAIQDNQTPRRHSNKIRTIKPKLMKRTGKKSLIMLHILFYGQVFTIFIFDILIFSKI